MKESLNSFARLNLMDRLAFGKHDTAGFVAVPVSPWPTQQEPAQPRGPETAEGAPPPATESEQSK